MWSELFLHADDPLPQYLLFWSHRCPNIDYIDDDNRTWPIWVLHQSKYFIVFSFQSQQATTCQPVSGSMLLGLWSLLPQTGHTHQDSLIRIFKTEKFT